MDEMEAGIGRLNDRLARINTTLIGILISLATGAILLAINILVVSAQ